MKDLQFGPLKLTLDENPFGPFVNTDAYPKMELIHVINALVLDPDSMVVEKLRQGQMIEYNPLEWEEKYASFVDNSYHYKRAVEFWLELTGEELEEPAYGLATLSSNDTFYIPQRLLIEIVEMLRKEREQAYRQDLGKIPPPWLFQPTPITVVHEPQEEAWIRSLEEEAKKVIKAETDLRISLERAIPFGTGWDEYDCEVRKKFLSQLEKYGLLSSSCLDYKYYWVRQWKLPLLETYIKAAVRLRSYLQSREREKLVPSEKRNLSIIESCISLDWFRWGNQAPNKITDYEWLALCEKAFCEHTDFSSLNGNFIIQGTHSQICLYWRKEQEDRPKFYSARFVF